MFRYTQKPDPSFYKWVIQKLEKQSHHDVICNKPTS